MKKLIINTIIITFVAATAFIGCGNQKDVKALSPVSQESIEESSKTRADDSINSESAKIGGGANVQSAEYAGENVAPTRIDSESADQTTQGKTGSASQDAQAKSPETTTAQPAVSAAPATDDLLAKLPEYVRAYLSPTNDPDKNKPAVLYRSQSLLKGSWGGRYYG